MTKPFRWGEPNLAPTAVKRQHYVPRFYLQSFCGADGNLRVIDLNDGNRQFRTSVENAAVESHFYDIEVEGVQLSTEDWLSQTEGEAAGVLRKLVDSPDAITALSDEEETRLARLLVALRFRVPRFRANLTSFRDNLVRQMQALAWKIAVNRLGKEEARARWDEWQKHPEGWWLREGSPEMIADVVAYMLGEVQGFANLLRAMSWRLGAVPAETRMCTSDCPVAGFLSPAQAAKYGAGFGEFQYYVPLSPGILLKVMPRDADSTPSRVRGSRVRRDFSTWDALFARNLLIVDATRYLFGDGLSATREHAQEHVSRVELSIMNFVNWLGSSLGYTE